MTFKCPRIPAHWGVVGSATTNGWNGPDISMEQSDKTYKWIARKVQLKDGEIKFRFHNDWTRNYGAGEQGALILNGGNVKVTAGVYDIILDLTDRWHPTFEMVRLVEQK
jgi:starch-binding outer membrane protein SusE/F